MAFDQPTRNRLARFVGEARSLLTEEFTRQLQHEYGLDPARGEVTELAKLTQLDDARRETARILRETLAHYLAGQAAPTAKVRQEALDRLVREQAFTVLNRLCALRMAEARGLLIESIAKGYQSRGFQLYARLAGPALGETGEAYRAYLFSLFDEFSVDLAVLFDRFSPQGRLFPRASTLLQLLAAINQADLEPLWAEDETIGWIYQYFNSKEERKAMRDASQAPRNSRELAVRNQFFTPRYVVEFLTDNTLGRIWYEMTQGRTSLVDSCRYLVRRPTEVFLRDPGKPLATPPRSEWTQQAARGDFSALPAEPELADLGDFSLIIDGYELAERHGYGDCIDWADRQLDHYRATGEWPTSSLALWLILFRQQRYHGRATLEPDQAFYDEWHSAYRAFRNSLQQNDLSQEALLRQPVYIPFRQIKDPRTILMLDPACGSMHFGLYSFDLYERIYEEAWEFEGKLGAHAFQRPAAMAPLRERYPDKASFLRDVPRLIIEHNIHGIDIDPRAVQIAGLSLWLRAQKSWQAQGLKPHERPTIRKSNIVCAEPMPGDKALLEEFLQGLRDDRLEALIGSVLNVPENQRVRATPTMADALCDLVRTVWEEMKLVGEAGSLLKIEESLAIAIVKSRKEWDEKLPLFRVTEFSLTKQPKVRLYQNMPGDEEDFWDKVEALVLAALAEYAEQAEATNYQRRLFAGDAAQGFAFIDLCRKRYDVVLMNPPFGEPTMKSKDYIEKSSGPAKADIYTAFLFKWCQLLHDNGRLGALTPRSFIYQIDFHEFRKLELIAHRGMPLLIELGFGELDDATNRTAGLIITPTRPVGEVSMYASIAEFIDKQETLHKLVSTIGDVTWKLAKISDFDLDDSSQFVFRLSSSFRSLLGRLSRLDPVLGKSHKGTRKGVANIVNGLQCPSDFRYVRLYVEVPAEEVKKIWFPFLKPVHFAPYVSEINCVVNWFSEGMEQKAEYRGKGVSPSKYISGESFYPSSGVWFPDVSERGIGAALISFPVIPGRMGLLAVGKDDTLVPPDSLAGFLNSIIAEGILGIITPERHHKPSYMGQIPWLENINCIESATSHYWSMAKAASAEAPSELSVDFVAPDLLLYRNSSLRQSIINVVNACQIAITEMITEQEKFDNFLLSQISADSSDSLLLQEMSNRSKISEWFPTSFSLTGKTEIDLISALFSYFLGNVFGRWDIVIGTKARPPMPRIQPRYSIPYCSVGILQDSGGLPITPANVPIDYPLRISWLGVLVNDSSHFEDIEQHIREVLRFIWPDCADIIEQEACEMLGVPSLRAYFANPNRFFDDHLKRYSKSRRAAPIYWPLSTPSGSYTLWLYYHRLTDQTLYSCVNDFVEPKLKQVNGDVDTLRRRTNRSRQEEKDLEQLSELALELAAFRDELLRIARFWQPNLNDGVQITAAPLWRLFQHRGWQKRLKETWAALEAGDYDWAHLAYSIWPERVREKCKTDKSLAIAHDLEQLYVEPVKPVKAKKGGGKKQVVDDDEQGELL